MTEQQRLRAIVHGHVQGVGYRATVEAAAARLGVTGWVRNRIDGCVDVLAEGSQAQLDRLLEVLRVGPRLAEVTDIEIEWASATGEFKRFSVRF